MTPVILDKLEFATQTNPVTVAPITGGTKRVCNHVAVAGSKAHWIETIRSKTKDWTTIAYKPTSK